MPKPNYGVDNPRLGLITALAVVAGFAFGLAGCGKTGLIYSLTFSVCFFRLES
jgi:hypothetical protein